MKTIALLLLLLVSCQLVPESITLNKSSETQARLAAISQPCVLSLDSIYTNNSFLKSPHDAMISIYNPNIAYVSGKGHKTRVDIDGSFAILDVSNPASLSIIGGYSGNGDQKDGETVQELSENFVLHYVSGSVLNFNVTDKTNPQVHQNVFYGSGVVNGAVEIASAGKKYSFGANKRGVIDVFDTTRPDSIFYLGFYVDGLSSTLIGPHDIAALPDKRIVWADRDTQTVKIAIVFDASGNLLPFQNWTITQLLHSRFNNCNRLGVVPNTSQVVVNGGRFISLVDCSGASPVFLRSHDAGLFSAGLSFTSDGKAIIARGIGIRILDMTTTPISVVCNFSDAINFSNSGNSNFHDSPAFINDWGILVTVQNANQVAVLKIN